MSEIQPRNPELNTVLLFLGGVILLTFCVGGILLFNQFIRRRVVTPTPLLMPIFTTLTLTTEQLAVVPTDTLVPTVTPVPTLIPSLTPTIGVLAVAPNSAGKSCRYGPPFINPVATPVPDGGRSEFENFLCVNGYWYIGTDDWVDARTGDWGSDGIEEKGYIMYNADGSVADRKFNNLQGTQIPGPKK